MNTIEFSLEERVFMEEVPSFVKKYGIDHTCLVYNLTFNRQLDRIEFRNRFVAYKAWKEQYEKNIDDFVDTIYEVFDTPIEALFDAVRRLAVEQAPKQEPEQPKHYSRVLL